MGRRLALLIGNGEYEDAHIERLSTPPRDVTALAAVLEDPALGAFNEVTTLVDETEARVRRAISAFFRERRRDDLLLLYFSGHGFKDDRGRLFWASKDTVHDDLAATAIPAAYVSEHMDQSRSRRQVVVLDCCYSGAFAAGAKGDTRVITRETLEGTGFGRVVLTASDSTQYALEGDRVVRQADLSLFTHYLIEGLSTGAAARPGAEIVTLDDWYDYAYEQVVSQLPSQTPCKWGYNQQGEIVISRAPRRASFARSALPPELTESLNDPRPWIRLGAVQELATLLAATSGGYADAARAALEQLRNDDSQRVRDSAVLALDGAREASPTPAPSESAIVSTPEPPGASPDADRGEAGETQRAAQADAESRIPMARSTGESASDEPAAGSEVIAGDATTPGEVAAGETTVDDDGRGQAAHPTPVPSPRPRRIRTWAAAGTLAVAATTWVLMAKTSDTGQDVSADSAKSLAGASSSPAAGDARSAPESTMTRPMTSPMADTLGHQDAALTNPSQRTGASVKQPIFRQGSAAAAILRGDTTVPITSTMLPNLTRNPAARESREGTVAAPSPAASTPPVAPAFDRAAAESAIRAIVERQKQATETRRLDLALGDITPALAESYRPKVAADFRALEELRNIVSTISALEIDVQTATQARARFHDVLTAVRRRNGETLTLFDGSITYDLTQAGGRWVIAAITTEPQRSGR